MRVKRGKRHVPRLPSIVTEEVFMKLNDCMEKSAAPPPVDQGMEAVDAFATTLFNDYNEGRPLPPEEPMDALDMLRFAVARGRPMVHRRVSLWDLVKYLVTLPVHFVRHVLRKRAV